MVKYDKSSIYKICCKDVNVKGEYVGSTTNMQRRKTQHKHNCYNDKKKDYNQRVYSYIRDNGGWENWDFIEVEKFIATDKNHLHTRERYWIELLKSELNCSIPMRTNKEWHIDNREYMKEYKKKYAEDNREHIVEYNKEYYTENSDKIKERSSKNYDINKDKINEKLKEKVTCECGSECRKTGLPRHLKSKKHIAYIQSIQL